MSAQIASLLARLVDFLIRRRLPILIASVIVTVLAVVPASRLSFNETIESMFSDDDPHLVDYLASKRRFGGDELVGVVMVTMTSGLSPINWRMICCAVPKFPCALLKSTFRFLPSP